VSCDNPNQIHDGALSHEHGETHESKRQKLALELKAPEGDWGVGVLLAPEVEDGKDKRSAEEVTLTEG
jgi:hypothetical protein